MIPRKKVEKLLEQGGFSEEEIERINLSSVCPPVLEINSNSMQETVKMWGDLLDGKGTSIKEVSTAYYQCLLFGEAIGVTIITLEPDLNNPGEWKEESKIEAAVYRKVSAEKWEKITILQGEDGQSDTISDSKLDQVTKVAKFIELLQNNA